jgi:hypothetical protein
MQIYTYFSIRRLKEVHKQPILAQILAVFQSEFLFGGLVNLVACRPVAGASKNEKAGRCLNVANHHVFTFTLAKLAASIFKFRFANNRVSPRFLVSDLASLWEAGSTPTSDTLECCHAEGAGAHKSLVNLQFGVRLGSLTHRRDCPKLLRRENILFPPHGLLGAHQVR